MKLQAKPPKLLNSSFILHALYGCSSFILLALLIRLVFAAFSAEVADVANYRRVAEILEQGGRLYSDTPGIYPYPPVWVLVERAALWLAQHTFIGFVFWVELLPVLADVGIVWLLYRLTRNQTGELRYAPLLYALNPVAILICAVHGQFDALPVFFVLVALYLYQTKRSYWLIALSLMAAIALKSYPVLLLPLFLIRLEGWRPRLVFSVVALFPVFLLVLPFLLSDFNGIYRELFQYSGVTDHGWVAVTRGLLRLVTGQEGRPLVELVLSFSKILFGLAYFGWLYLSYQRRNRPQPLSLTFEIALVYALFYVVYGGLSSQYLVWILPFLLLLNLRLAIIYTLVATLALLTFYNYQWPVIIYRAPVQFFPKMLNGALWIAGTGLWWLVVTAGLVQIFRKLLAGKLYLDEEDGTQKG